MASKRSQMGTAGGQDCPVLSLKGGQKEGIGIGGTRRKYCWLFSEVLC